MSSVCWARNPTATWERTSPGWKRLPIFGCLVGGIWSRRRGVVLKGRATEPRAGSEQGRGHRREHIKSSRRGFSKIKTFKGRQQSGRGRAFQECGAELAAAIFKRSSTGRWDGVRPHSFHQLKFTQVVSTFRKQKRLEKGYKSLRSSGSSPKPPSGFPTGPTEFGKVSGAAGAGHGTQHRFTANKNFRTMALKPNLAQNKQRLFG